MPQPDSSMRDLFTSLDQFLQWDLVTVTPWGAPAISPVGARLITEEAAIWTSTTVGYATKIRNIRAHPRVALMRVHPNQPSVMVRGEANVVAGDGTRNLAQLFRLMGGAGGTRRFFATTASDPFWSRLYRSYWQRFLIVVRIVEISSLGPDGWETTKVASWSPTQAATPPRAVRGRSQPHRGGQLDTRGRAMIVAGTPAALATVRREGAAPMIWPVQATPELGGELRVEAAFPLPPGRLRHSSLAVRVIDDSFEVAQTVGWIGTLEPGDGPRLLRPRLTYGFAKPPGVVGDLAAGLAALVGSASQPHPCTVSSPDLARAVELAGSAIAPQLELPEPTWRLLEQIFARRNAAGPWYAAMAAVVPNQARQRSLTILAERAQMERDWALGLLTRGARRVGAMSLAAAVLSMRPNPTSPESTAAREEAQIGRMLSRVAPQLPPRVAGPPARIPGVFARRPGREIVRSPDRGLSGAALAAAAAAAAALDRWTPRRPR
ncbi:MAG TPA: pyridoxamine 5'-phosphate oxidase family protein [Candidatus Micrarchaeaceae archaeon]|nr:pyridoxamine 5'-phosphate oxidase family protein [Candidatus Micrarchaeaceae archaeon]